MKSCLRIDTPLGTVRLVADAQGLRECRLTPEPTEDGPVSPVLQEAARQLKDWLAGKRHDFDLPLAPEGTDFQRRVWRELRTIPFGETMTYGDLAKAIGNPTASRAVGAANGQNPLWIIVPCHRVIGASGKLTGYAGGLSVKQWLLEHEARQCASSNGPGTPSHVIRRAAEREHRADQPGILLLPALN